MDRLGPQFHDTKTKKQAYKKSQSAACSQVSTSKSSSSLIQQNTYQIKCNLLEYHIEEATLINKALKSELNQFKDKIEFERKLSKFLVSRASTANS